MDIRHPVDPAITLRFDEGVWAPDTAAATRGGPFTGGMGGAPVPAAAAAAPNPDFDWLLRQVAADPGISASALPDLVRRPGASTRALDPNVTPVVTVDLAPGESAALLVECEGVVAWQLPEEEPAALARGAARAAAPRQVRFTVRAPGAATAATAQQRNVFTDWMLDRVRSVVLKFAATAAAGAIVTQLEKSKRTGPVVIAPGVDATDWLKPDDFKAVPLPATGARVLLLVHGTFSSTAGGFGELHATQWGQSLLEKASQNYDAILGFDHRTLSVEPSDNAQRLYAALQTLPTQQPPTIDIVCHSRGALVTRWLIEKILPGAAWKPAIGKVVFVGGTNAGTDLARPENWHALLDLLTNLALAGRKALTLVGAPQAGLGASEIVKGIADFVRYLVDAGVEGGKAPGLGAMNPDGAFVHDINTVEPGAPTPENAQYYAVSSNFRPVLIDAQRHEPKEFPRRLALMLANGFIGALMKKADNDLVVNVGSMSDIEGDPKKYVKGVQDFGTNPIVYHTNYFVQPETVDAVAGWLGLPPVHAVEAVNHALMNPRVVVVDAGTLVKEALGKAATRNADYVVFRRPDPDYPGTLHYAPSVVELQHLHPDNPIGDALHVRESRRSPVVANAPFLRSLKGRTAIEPSDSLPPYSHRAVVVEGGVPVAVIPDADAALDVLRRAVTPAVRSTPPGMRSFTRAKPPLPPTAGAEPPEPPTAMPAPAPAPTAAMPAPAPAPTAAEPVVCNVQAEMPPRVKVGAIATVTVTLSADAIAATPGVLSEHAPVKLQKRAVTIEVIPRVGFRLRSNAIEDSRVTLEQPPAAGEPCVIDVDVVATDEGQGEIWAVVRQGPVRSATVVLRPQVVPGAAADATAPRLVSEASVQAGEDLPDVATLEITQQRNGSETRFRYGVYVPEEAFDRFESPPITGDLAAWVQQLYKDIEGAWLGSKGNIEIFHDQLQARGAALFDELIPPMLAQLLWRLHGEGKLKSVLVNSDEPFVPWEIAYMQGTDAAGVTQGCFFGQLGLCRWLFGAVPPTHIRVRPDRMRYVVPHYPEQGYRLEEAEGTEEPMLQAMGAQKVVPHYREVTAALGSGEFDLLHFAGHGGADGGSIAGASVLLEGSYQQAGGGQAYVTEPLAATVVAQKAKLCGPDRNRPIVVLNACQVGRLGFNLTSLGGFAPAFLGARVGESRGVGQAGVFVSSLWSVGDEPASVFAQTFYQELRVPGGTTIARAVTAAREAARASGDATWLAYAVYAHPNCHVEFTP